MRYRIKDYKGLNHKITLTNTSINSVEDIRLIINETQKKVLCSSMQKDNVISVESDGKQSVITLIETLSPIENTDDITIEIDDGDPRKLNIITFDEYKSIKPKEFKTYYIAKSDKDKEMKKVWRIYLRTQLMGEFNVDGGITMPKFPMRFPFRFA